MRLGIINNSRIDGITLIYALASHSLMLGCQDRDIEKAKKYWQVYQEEQDKQET